MSKENKDIDISPEEMEKIHHALKDEKFRDMFFDYCKEISDPENRAKYEAEISQLEKERGYDVTFVKPEAGHVIKVIDENQNKKVFINVCTSTNVERAGTDGTAKTKGQSLGFNWTVPHIINKPREDTDKAGKSCVVCDVVFHPEIYSTAKTQPNMMKMLNDIALDSIRDKCGMKLDRNNVKFPKLKFKGRQEASIIRNKTAGGPSENHQSAFVKYPEPENDSFDAEKELRENETKKTPKTTANDVKNNKTVDENSDRTKPHYKIVHRGHFDLQNFTLARNSTMSTRPAELCVEIELPMARSVAGVDLDVFEKRLVLESKKPNYYLDLSLPYPVDEDKGKAQFDKSRKVLIVTLPVLPPKTESSDADPDIKSNIDPMNGHDSEIDQQNNDHVDENQETNTTISVGKTPDDLREKDFGHVEKEIEFERRLKAGDFENAVESKDNASGAQTPKNNRELTSRETKNVEDSDYNTCKSNDSTKINGEDSNRVFRGHARLTDSSVKQNSISPRTETPENACFSGELATGNSESVTPKSSILEENSKQRDFETNYNSYRVPAKSSFLKDDKTAKSTADEILMHRDTKITPKSNCKPDPINSGKKIVEMFNADTVNQQVEENISESNQNSNVEDALSDDALSGSPNESCFDKINGVSPTLGPFSLEFASVPDIAGMYKIPPYSYTQDEETITVNINISNVRMENVSLGFSNRKVYFSVVTDSEEDSDRERWCLIMKFLEYCHLDSDSCSIDVEENRVILLLQKTEDSFGLWNKFYAGSSEKNLEELFFLTDHSMSELFERIRDKNDPWAKKQKDTTEETEKENEFATRQLEANLEQLLREQNLVMNTELDINENEDGMRPENEESADKHEIDGSDAKTKHKADCVLESESQQSETDSDEAEHHISISSDLTVPISLDDLQDDVICDAVSPPVYISRAPVERSLSEEHPRGLRSILKRSTSCSTSEESDASYYEDKSNFDVPGPSVRLRSKSLNVDTRPVPRERPSISRDRNKSVSFDLEPQVCEFIEYSKKQLKKMRKQERKQTEIAAKKSEALAKNAKNSHKNKHGKNKGGKNRNFFNSLRKDYNRKSSEDISEFESEDLDSKAEDNEKPDIKEKTENIDQLSRKVQMQEQHKDKYELHEQNGAEKVKEAKLSSKKKNASIEMENNTLMENSGTNSSVDFINTLIYELDG